MYERDVALLACPRSRSVLTLGHVTSVDPEDGEILEGELVSAEGQSYPIVDGIPRFVGETANNRSWDFKWFEIDKGAGLNYRLIEPGVDNLITSNAHGGAAYRHMQDRLVLDYGCGVGQYTVAALRDHGADRVVSVDLTRAVDVFRKIIRERFPELKRRIVLVQASVFAPPFLPDTFDYVFSLGVLHHTGSTIEAIRKACSLVKPGGQVNLWVYAAFLNYFEAREPGHLHVAPPPSMIRRTAKVIQLAFVRLWMRIGRSVSLPNAYRMVRLFSSNTWFRLSSVPGVGVIPRLIFPSVLDPDPNWRLINNFDGYVNAYAESWSEHELFPVLQECGIIVKGLSVWRCGLWGVKAGSHVAGRLEHGEVDLQVNRGDTETLNS